MDNKGKRRKGTKQIFSEKAKALRQVLTDFCQNTSAHGFQYWVSSDSYFERLLWVAIVAFGFLTAYLLVQSVTSHRIHNPTSVAIKTFSKPANEVPYPAITICNENGFDVGQYIRAVFDNFQYSCSMGERHDCGETELLRSHFPGYAGVINTWTGVCELNRY